MRALLIALLALALLPALAVATTPGHWDAVTSVDGSNIDQVGLVRTPDGVLHVAWTRKTPGNTVHSDLMHTTIAANGTVGPAQTVASDWIGIGSPTIALDRNGLLAIVAGATHTLDPGSIDSIGIWRAAASGALWIAQATNAATEGGFSDTPMLAFGSDGVTPFFAWGATGGLFVHRGNAGDAPQGNLQQAAGWGCCGYDPGIALDGSSGQLVVGWYSNATGHLGVYAQAIDQATGAGVGSPVAMPGSTTRYGGQAQSSQSLAHTPVVSRPGKPGVFLAYAGGYPTTTKVLVWRFGAARSSRSLARSGSNGIDDVTLAAAPDGRLWVVWSSGTRIYARRSNPQLSSWGAPVSVPARRRTETIFKLAANAQSGALDVLGAFAPLGGNGVQTWHTQLLPGLTVGVSPTRLRLGEAQFVTARVSDAGAPVAGARVRLGAAVALTRANGKATFVVPPFSRAGHATVHASKSGYMPGAASVRIKRPS